jgi:hypothetical protein
MKIDVTFHCTATDGKCVYKLEPYKCVSMTSGGESFTCPYFEVRRKPSLEVG